MKLNLETIVKRNMLLDWKLRQNVEGKEDGQVGNTHQMERKIQTF